MILEIQHGALTSQACQTRGERQGGTLIAREQVIGLQRACSVHVSNAVEHLHLVCGHREGARQARGRGGGEIHDGEAVAKGYGGESSGGVVGDGVGVAIELQAGDDAWRKSVAQIDDTDAIGGGDRGQT